MLRTGHQYILKLDVSVGNLLLVHVVQGQQNLLNQLLCVDFRNGSVLLLSLQDQVVEESAISHQLRHNIVVMLVMQQLVDLHDARMVELLKQLHFILQILFLALRLDVLLADELDGAVDLGVQMECLSDSSESSLSQNLVDSVPLFNIADLFEPDEVLKSQDELVPLVEVHVHGSLAHINGQRH